MQGSNGNPRARSARLLVEEVGDELVVYDLDTDLAHLLNRTTAAVWRRCDGATSVKAIAKGVGAELGIAASTELVMDAMTQLEQASLLQGGGVSSHGLSRRQMLKIVGVTAAAIPVVTTILAPTPAAAVSIGAPIGGTCKFSNDCASCNCQNSTKTCIACSAADCVTSNNNCPHQLTAGQLGTCNATSGNCN
jgi:hypothetical protein